MNLAPEILRTWLKDVQGSGLFCSPKNCEDLLMTKKLTYEDLEQRVRELEEEVIKHKMRKKDYRTFKLSIIISN